MKREEKNQRSSFSNLRTKNTVRMKTYTCKSRYLKSHDVIDVGCLKLYTQK